MIRHVIMWKFTEEFEGMNKDMIMDDVEEKFRHLKKTIPEIKFMSVERDVLRSARSFDMIYVTEFESLEALEVYRVHPEHVKVAEFIGKIRTAQANSSFKKFINSRCFYTFNALVSNVHLRKSTRYIMQKRCNKQKY